MTLASSEQLLLDRVFAAVDAMDTERFLDCIAQQGSFRFGSSPAAIGHDNIRAAVNGFFATISGLRHVLHKSVVTGSTIMCEGEVTYTRQDGTSITLPFVDVFEMQDKLISEYKIYMDIAPLYAQ